jgi:hypothetical protein|tara:strand:+ start:3511 stop:3933 length:423 start_codon:yes stop_codon:yes gene_type:complete
MAVDLKIKVATKDVPLSGTRKEFLRQFLSNRPPTYFLNGREQASAKTHRSFSDLHALTKNRFQRTSLDAIIRIVAQLNIEGLCDVVWCGQVKKFVVRGGKSSPGIPFVTNYSVKYFEKTKGEDGITYEQLIQVRTAQNIK